jgi:hypothetical protein
LLLPNVVYSAGVRNAHKKKTNSVTVATQHQHHTAAWAEYVGVLFRLVTTRIVPFKVCKSVHRRTIQIDHQPDATVFQFIILTFIYSPTCFGRSPAHHQKLNDCSSSLWFYLLIVVIAVLCLWSGQVA